MGMSNYMLRESSITLMQEKGLVEGVQVTKLFESLYEYYGKYLLLYLDKKLGLSRREQEIKDSALQMKPVKESDKDAYQSLSPLEFFFVRNNLKIERLPEQFIELLKRRVFQQKEELDEKTEQMIELTYRDVIRNEKYKDGTHINYGPTTSTDFFAPNDALVLGFRFDPEYETDTNDNPDWMENYMRKETLARALCRLIRSEAEKQDLPVYVIEYNEATVTKEGLKQDEFQM